MLARAAFASPTRGDEDARGDKPPTTLDQRAASYYLPLLALGFLGFGAVVRLHRRGREATIVWMIGLVLTGLPVIRRTIASALRGHFATDVVATLAVATSVASSLQPLAGLVIVLMQTGGEALERYAEGRASAAVRALEEEAPRIAHRIPAGESPRSSAGGRHRCRRRGGGRPPARAAR